MGTWIEALSLVYLSHILWTKWLTDPKQKKKPEDDDDDDYDDNIIVS